MAINVMNAVFWDVKITNFV